MSSTAVQYSVTIFSTGSKFQPVSNFTELHALTQATRSYALLTLPMKPDRQRLSAVNGEVICEDSVGARCYVASKMVDQPTLTSDNH